LPADYASVSNLEEQKCEKDIKQDITTNGSNIKFSVLGKFYTLNIQFHCIKIGHIIIVEDLRSAF